MFVYFRRKGENKQKGRRKVWITVVLKQTCLPYLSTVTTSCSVPAPGPKDFGFSLHAGVVPSPAASFGCHTRGRDSGLKHHRA